MKGFTGLRDAITTKDWIGSFATIWPHLDHVRSTPGSRRYVKGCGLLRWATSAHSTAILTQQSEASIFAVSWPSGTQLIDLQIEHAVEGTLP